MYLCPLPLPLHLLYDYITLIHDTSTTKYQNFSIDIYSTVSQLIHVCFGHKGTIIREKTKSVQHKTKLVTFV